LSSPSRKVGAPRYELADDRLAHALGDLLNLILVVDPEACADADEKGCC
jgi:hypothetical protein